MTGEEDETTQSDFNEQARTMLGEPTQEEELAKLTKQRSLADAPEMLNYANVKKRLELPSLGNESSSYYVEYCPLRIEDNITIKAITHENEEIQRNLRNRKKAHLILSRADNRYTERIIKELASVIIDAILMEYDEAEDSHFLLPILKRRSDGLTQTLKPNDSS